MVIIFTKAINTFILTKLNDLNHICFFVLQKNIYLCTMFDMRQIIEVLHREQCSLVVRNDAGEVTLYNKKGVRDLVWLLDNEPGRLRGASVADKVVGKASAGLLVQGGVAEVYADVMSRLAIPLLDAAGIKYSCGETVDRIVIPKGDDRCPLERIVLDAKTASDVEALLRQHFEEMRNNPQNS